MKYRIYTDGESQFIERLVYPRLKGVIKFSSSLTDVEEVEVIDKEATPTELATAMREVGEYLINHKRQ